MTANLKDNSCTFVRAAPTFAVEIRLEMERKFTKENQTTSLNPLIFPTNKLNIVMITYNINNKV